MTPIQEAKLKRPELREKLLSLIAEIYPKYSKLGGIGGLIERKLKEDYGIRMERFHERSPFNVKYVIIKDRSILKSFILSVESFNIDILKALKLEAEIYMLEYVKTLPKPIEVSKVYNPFTDEFLEHIGFKRTKGDENSQYGAAESLRPKGKRILEWNVEGYHCDYFGTPLRNNIALGIKEDGGTRTVFNGLVYSISDIKHLLQLVQ